MPQQLDHPFSDVPAPGKIQEIAPGIKWIRMPMPMKLDHINLYLIRDEAGWMLVDTGLYGDQTQNYWQQIFTNELDGLPITGVIVTHMHPDHAGQAGWISRLFEAPLWMSRAEYLHARLFSDTLADGVTPEALVFFQRAGVTGPKLEQIQTVMNSSEWRVEPLPGSYRRLSDGDQLWIGKHPWQVYTGYGHSPEHVCLYSPQLKLLISGDQVLPQISPNISVSHMEPEANPLASWIQALQRLSVLPDDTLVLPAHNAPFQGLQRRITALLKHNEAQLLALEKACQEPKTVSELVSQNYRDNLQPTEQILALGECLARLNCLIDLGRITRQQDSSQFDRYQACRPRRDDQTEHWLSSGSTLIQQQTL